MNPLINLPEPLTLGLHALVTLGRKGKQQQTTAQLAQSIGCSVTHLSKVLQKLTKAGYLQAHRGPGGGYELPIDPDRIFLIWIFELLGGPFRPEGCGLSHPMERQCVISSMIDELILSLREFLATKTLADLLKYDEVWPRLKFGVTVEPYPSRRTSDEPSGNDF